MLDKIRTAAAGGAAPDVAKMPILWGVEFAARGDLSEVTLEEFGWTAEQFWPGALKSVTWEDKFYGVPTNNETMAFIWNKQIFADAGLDPETPPATWDDVVAYSNQIKQETGKNGYGMVAKVNAGNTPFRFMPVLWAYGASALDEAEDSPTYETTMINTPEGIAALQVYYDMYVRDRSVPTSALTNTQTENQDIFLAGEIAMMISHPSEYVAIKDRAEAATGADKERADQIVANMAYGLIPEGPARRAVVFGGSNAHIMSDAAHGSPVNRDAARALMAMLTGPEWSLKNNWADSNLNAARLDDRRPRPRRRGRGSVAAGGRRQRIGLPASVEPVQRARPRHRRRPPSPRLPHVASGHGGHRHRGRPAGRRGPDRG
jgi:multiple sugar transport system substrate-binding protein